MAEAQPVSRYTFKGSDYAQTKIEPYEGLKDFLFFDDAEGQSEGRTRSRVARSLAAAVSPLWASSMLIARCLIFPAASHFVLTSVVRIIPSVQPASDWPDGGRLVVFNAVNLPSGTPRRIITVILTLENLDMDKKNIKI